MKQYSLSGKVMVCGILVLFLSMSIMPITGCEQFSIFGHQHSNTSVGRWTTNYSPTIDEGTLSGYVTDSERNPIEGARVRVYFHETYRENYSDSTGYYHVTDISICYCSKNATCSKEGYKTEWVWLSIYENTAYDFVLTPFEGYSYPEFDGMLGQNGWYVSSVVVAFNGSINDTVYRINGSTWVEYTIPFKLNSQGIHLLEWICYSNRTDIYSVEIKIDWLPPNVSNITSKWIGLFKCQFNADSSDELSGLKYVKFPFGTIDSEPPYQAIRKGGPLRWWLIGYFPGIFGYYTWNACDNAGNCYDEPSYR